MAYLMFCREYYSSVEYNMSVVLVQQSVQYAWECGCRVTGGGAFTNQPILHNKLSLLTVYLVVGLFNTPSTSEIVH